MATVRLSDVVIPEVYMSYTSLNTPELTAYAQAGIVATNDLLQTATAAGGMEFTVPFWRDLDTTEEPNYSNDDPEDLAVPEKVGTGRMKARKAFVNNGWSDMDLVVELSGSDPMRHIRNRTGFYWQRQWQYRLVANTLGIYRDNIANHNSDMAIVAEDELFNQDLVIDAADTMGDAGSQFVAIAVHSKVHTRMVKNDEIVWEPDSEGKLTIATYMGMRVIKDDGMPVLSGTGADRVFLSVLFGRSAMGFAGLGGHVFAAGEGIPKTPVALDRTEEAGNGGGMEVLWERHTWMLHPFGYSWVEGEGADALVEMSPTLADLGKAAHWQRVVYRKQIPMAFIASKA